MKNIHILSTNKLSKIISSGKEFTLLKNLTTDKRCKNIYITFDEEIKNDWFIFKDDNTYVLKSIGNTDNTHIKVKSNNKYGYGDWNKDYCKKIILTTDQDLIEDGVQAIDDEFLEWFVKNPSCEKIETKVKFIQTPDNLKDGFYYKLIIPEEKPKQCCDSGIVDDFCINTLKCKHAIEKSKQETPEEETLAKIKFVLSCGNDGQAIRLLEQYSQYQLEKSYSEENMKSAFKAGYKKGFSGYPNTENWKELPFDKWFEQLKKIMNKEFIPYQQALDLKKLGFDEKCFGYFTGDLMHLVIRPAMSRVNEPESYVVTAPLYQQAFRWFREKYHIIGEVKFKGGKTTKTAWYDYVIYSEIDWNDENPNEQWKKHEEAELECLKKLIEITKKNEKNINLSIREPQKRNG